MMDEDGDAARAMHRDFLHSRGVDLDAMDDDQRRAATDRQFAGTPDEVAGQLRERVLDPAWTASSSTWWPTGTCRASCR